MEIPGFKLVTIYFDGNVYRGLLTENQAYNLVMKIKDYGEKNNYCILKLRLSFGKHKVKLPYKESDIKSIDQLRNLVEMV